MDLRVAIVNLLLTGRKHFFRETEKKTNQFYLGKKPIVMHPQNYNPKSIIITQICYGFKGVAYRGKAGLA